MLLPHILAATSHLDPAGPNAAMDPDAAWLPDRAATYLRVHARPQEARPLAERALAITKAAHGPDHATVGIRLGSRGGIGLSPSGYPGDHPGPAKGAAIQSHNDEDQSM